MSFGRLPKPDEAFVALGSNLGDRAAHLRGAVRALREHPDVRGAEPSPVYETEAHTRRPGEAQPAYLNAALRLRTALAPEALLALAHRLEAATGRRRAEETARWQPRTLDVDLLTVGRHTRRSERLTLPHPRLAERRFVLRPWADLAPNLRVPAPFDATVSGLLERCPDDGKVVRARGLENS